MSEVRAGRNEGRAASKPLSRISLTVLLQQLQLRTTKSNLFWPLLLALIWIGMIVAVNPIGDFPLIDDWAYGYSVKALVEHGQIRFSDWTATNLFAQALWGGLFCLPFGFSFSALRISTAVLGLVGVVATYGILRELKSSRGVAAVGALTLALCPIYVALSVTFMNDVPFVAVATASLYFFIRGMRLDSGLTIALGLLLAGIAILTRQTGVALPIGFACALLVKKGVQPRYLLLAFLLAVSGVAVQFAYQTWLVEHHLLSLKFNNQIFSLLGQTGKDLRAVLRDGLRISLFILAYLGLFALPAFVLLFPKWSDSFRRWPTQSLLALGFSTAFVVGGLVWIGRPMPVWKNVLDKGGIGPGSMLGKKSLAAPELFWTIVTGLSLIGGVALLESLFLVAFTLFFRSRGSSVFTGSWPLALLTSISMISFLPLPLLGLSLFGFYDRYTIFFIPLVIPTLIGLQNRKKKPAGALFALSLVLLTVYMVFSVAATHDYLAWNRVRWALLHDLMRKSGVPPEHIYGGSEFNGWYLYERYAADPKRRWFWAEKDDYLASFDRLEGYEVIARGAVQRWLPWQRHGGDVLIEHRVGPGTDLGVSR